jgi:hypothetical protein
VGDIMSGVGRIKMISISKIKKIKVILKNRIEKGKRLKEKGSSPHSKGEDFSLLNVINFLHSIKINIINIIKKMICIMYNIILFETNFLIGS